MNTRPAALDHAGIAARVPHQGRMCLLDALLAWDPNEIRCRIVNHADAAHPLRTDAGLLSCTAIEYAAQAMALHAALNAGLNADVGSAPTPGFLASARDVRLHAPRLDTALGPLEVRALRQAGDAKQALYRFELTDAQGSLLVSGRAAVVLNTPLPTPLAS
jgi:predicted hotdog family 3-hydroxylacyl-ACP dehydratase